MLLVVVGDVDSDEVLDGLERLRLMEARPRRSSSGGRTRWRPPGLGNRADARQGERGCRPRPPGDLERRSPDYVPCISPTALGQSSLTSRLGVRVRDTEGLTYGIHSLLRDPPGRALRCQPHGQAGEPRRGRGRHARGDPAVPAGRNDPEELADERSSHVGRFKVDLASNGGIAHAIDAAVYYGLGVSYLDLFPSLVEAVTKEQADAAFAKRVNPDLFTIVSAGVVQWLRCRRLPKVTLLRSRGRGEELVVLTVRRAPRIESPTDPIEGGSDSQKTPVPQAEPPPSGGGAARTASTFRTKRPSGGTHSRREAVVSHAPRLGAVAGVDAAYRAGILGMTREDREAVLRFEFQGASVGSPRRTARSGSCGECSSVASTPSTESSRAGGAPTRLLS